MNTLSVASLFLLVCLALIGAEEPVRDRTGTSDVLTDEIFESILQNLPHDMKARVDSASGVKAAVHDHADKLEDKLATAIEQGKSRHEDALRQLPEDLRERVRRTMDEMENEQQKRAVQFRDRKQSAGD